MKIRTFGALLGISVAASAGIGWKVGWQAPPLGWHGKVAKIVRGGGAEELRGARGTLVTSGSIVATDRKQRARLEMDDGSVLVLDRDTEIELDPTPNTRVVHVRHGVVAADVAHKDGFAPAKILTEKGEVLVVGTELTVTATDDTTDVQVTRGSVRARASGGKDVDVEAGQEALISARGVDVGPAAISGAGDLLGNEKVDEDTSSGVGELRARRPGRTDDKDRTLRIASHAVKVRIAGAMARTEIEETFANDTNDDLEGIYRFPVPAGALVDRLALEVDGKLVDGAFVEKTRAAKILKGAIANATPLVKPREDIVWVPGPWRDPALLEWQQGGRFELRIFPIPKHGSRRIVLGYTQTVDASLGLRRYVYPLPSSGAVRMDDFSVDAQIVGADAAVPIHARGYDLVQSAEHLSFHESGFEPRGDLSIQYALPNRSSELSAWGFDDGAGQSFVAMAIRPKLPASAEARPRDWAIVVDSGRSMFGERFTRASRVAVALAQTLDRRDRVTVLACDVECRRNSSGYVPAGAAGAKAVNEFLATLVPDGASDLAGAVRNAASLGGDASRELRVVLVSDGVASAGYKRASRLADEVRDSVPKNGAVLAVPVGSDADDDTLAEIARGGGGVVVPYAPGARVEDVVFALAGAGAGALLRDATLELPQGLTDAAPKALSTMRVGGETYVVAKMNSNETHGDVVLRGTAGGEAFEARYPIDVKATSDAGNAFVPRLFAAKRIRDLERDGSDGARTEAIALSQKLAVPSKLTSLLVLENEAMFKAFGIDRETSAPRWTGESLAASDDVVTTTTTPVETAADETATGNSTQGLLAEKHSSQPLPQVPQSITGGGGGSGGGGHGDALGAEFEDAAKSSARARPWGGWGNRRGGRFMRRVFHREATVASFDGTTIDGAERVTTARAALAAAPDDRAKHRDLARALLRRGALDELERVLADWQKRDPLDGDAIALRAELLSARGDRVAAARVLSGVAASAGASRIDDLALGAERAGDDVLACALRVASAEDKPEDVSRVARAVRCERLRGRTTSAERWLVESGARRAAVESAVSKQSDSSSVSGDVVVDASWTTSADLDVAVIDPNGQRLGWLAGRGSVQDATSRSHEKLGVGTSGAGTFLVEIARSDGGTSPVSGFLNVTAFGMSKRVPFVLTGASARVARVDVRFVSELVPIDQPEIGIGIGVGSFDESVARARVNAISLQQCSVQEGPFGSGNATVTFDPSGGVSSVGLASPFSMGRAGACVRRALMTARVAPFAGSARMVTRNFVVAP